MSTMLVLGSKPAPTLPPTVSFDQLACANGSGISAARLGLPSPTLTVMSATLSSGIQSGRQTLNAMRGLSTDELHFFPRPPKATRLYKSVTRPLIALRARPATLKRQLRAVDYHYQRFIDHNYDFYQQMLDKYCGDSTEVHQQLRAKQPSTGLMTILLALSRSTQVIIAGFSFELTHAYDRNPDITARGSKVSRHANTDITILKCLNAAFPGLRTSEPVVARHTGIPIYTDAKKTNMSY